MRFILFFLLTLCVFSPLSAQESESPTQTIEASFSSGEFEFAIKEIAKLPASDERNTLIMKLFTSNQTTDVSPSPAQILDLMKMMQTHRSLSQAEIQLLGIMLKRAIVSDSDATFVQNAFIAGVGSYGGKTGSGKINAANFFKLSQMLDYHVLFLPDFKEELKANRPTIALQTLNGYLDRAKLSGREKDAIQAWNMISLVVHDSAYTQSTLLTKTVDREIAPLMVMLPGETAAPLITFIAQKYPQKMTTIYSQLVTLAQQKMAQNPPTGIVDKLWWRTNYNTLKWVSEMLAAQGVSSLNPSLARGAQLWLTQTQKMVRNNESKMRAGRQIFSRQKNGHEFLTTTDAKELLEMVPSGAWMAIYKKSNSIDPLLDCYADLCMIQDNYEGAVDYILQSNQSSNTKFSRCLRLLNRMAESLNPNTAARTNNQPVSTIALTRLSQVNNLRQFRSVLAKMTKEGIDVPFDTKLRVFEAMYSAAEVYNYDDLVFTFGKPESFTQARVLTMINHLLDKQKEWSSVEVQTRMNTRRSQKETEVLAGTGYALIERFISEALRGVSARTPMIHAYQGMILYREAAYLAEINASETWVESKRSEGLMAFQRAADIYAESVPYLYESQYVIDIYNVWLEAFLVVGTGKTAVKDRPNVEAIRESIMKMPHDAAMKHLERFANHMYAEMSRQGPYTRRAYILTALRVVKGTRIEPRFRDRLNYYDGLLNEAKLSVSIDQEDGLVGGGQIGLRVRLHYTPELAREAGGFSRYLLSAENPTHAMALTHAGIPTAVSIASRESVEKSLRECLEPSFDILSIAFGDPKAAPRREKDGYESIPLAYFLLRPKDITVDQIPPLSFDMEFADHGDMVYLQTLAEATPFTYAPSHKTSSPRNLNVVQRVSFRDLERGTGRVTLEVLTTASSLIGDWNSILTDSEVTGFTISDVEDGGSQVKEYSTENADIQLVFERNWTLHLTPKDVENIPLTFAFPQLKVPATMKYLSTHDVNFKEVASICPVRSASGLSENVEAFSSQYPGFIRGLIVTAILVVFLGVFWVLWRAFRCVAPQHVDTVAPPKKLTAFSLLHYLRALSTGNYPLSDTEKTQLLADIGTLEARYFAHNSQTQSEEDLQILHQIFERWIHFR